MPGHHDSDGNAATKPIIYMIRHGEKPPKVDGKDQESLSAQGVDRAQGLRKVFSEDSGYDIQWRSRATIRHGPTLADELGLKIHSKIDRDDVQDAADAAKAYQGPGNVLVCWEHGQLAKIATAMGVRGYAESTGWTGDVVYPDHRFDLIWTVKDPHDVIDSVTSEGVEGLDQDLTGKAVAQDAVGKAGAR